MAWTLDWSEPFNGSSLNPAYWNIRDGGWYPEWHLPANVAVSDGALRITAKNEEYGGMHYTSGMVHTQNKKEYKYAKVEIRAKLCHGCCQWPALWMMPASMPDEGWNVDPEKVNGEIDIMEQAYNWGMPVTWIQANLHTGAPLHSYPTMENMGYATDTNSIIYGLEWYPEGTGVRLKWYWRLFGPSQPNHYYKNTNAWYTSDVYPHPYDHEFFIIIMLNAGVKPGLPWYHEPPCTELPATMIVEDLKVWKLVETV